MKIDFKKLDRAFNPQTVVVVGDKGELRWLRDQSTFKGKLYSVQISPEAIQAIEALGVKNYTSLLDIPDRIDLVIVSVARAIALRILEDCIRKDVAAAHFFTAGFSETNTDDGKELERRLVERAEKANFNLIGPNCLGIFNPGAGVKHSEMQYSGISGRLGFISQSGTHATNFSVEAHTQGVDINKSVSFGNGFVLDSPDFLEYFGNDEGTKCIGMYLEGVKDGRRFLSVLKKVSARKPVVIWKGGRTEEGGRAISSHTASLAVPQDVWNAAIRQCGAVSVRSIEELIDTLQALLYLSPVRGNRIGIAGASGGQSVATCDAFAEAGLTVPRLSQKSYDEFATFFKAIGGSYGNPIDAGPFNVEFIKRILEILEQDENVDSIVYVCGPSKRGFRPEDLKAVSALAEIRQRAAKAVMVVTPFSSIPEQPEEVREVSRKTRDQGIPVFSSLGRAARALNNIYEYYRRGGVRMGY